MKMVIRLTEPIFIAAIQVIKWHTDGKCGPNHLLQSGEPGQCDPNASGNGKGPCCSTLGWCGNSALHCECEGCIDYRGKDVYIQTIDKVCKSVTA